MSIKATPAPARAASSACARVSTVSHLIGALENLRSAFCHFDQSAKRERALINGAPRNAGLVFAKTRSATAGAAIGINGSLNSSVEARPFHVPRPAPLAQSMLSFLKSTALRVLKIAT